MINYIKSNYGDWVELRSKSVMDFDGFLTDYTLYTDGKHYICVFGDKDVYGPDIDYADYETESKEDAYDWFESYDNDDTEWEMRADRFDDIESPYYNGDLDDDDFDTAITSAKSVKKYPIIDGCADKEYLYSNLSNRELALIEGILSAYTQGKIDLYIDRYDDGTVKFDGDHELVVNDSSYRSVGIEIPVIMWYESFEDTGYLVDVVRGYGSKPIVSTLNEFGETKYAVTIGTGTATPYTEEVYAYNEQEALDKVVDRMEESGETGFLTDYYELYDETEFGETVDELADRMNLVVAGNSGWYVEVIDIHEV